MMMSNLPKDLVEEILSRVPAAALRRLRSTWCIPWSSISMEFFGMLYDKYVLGYETNTSSPSYKILRVLFCQHIFKMEIYEVNSNSWRVLDVTPDWYIRSCGVALKENTYWFVRNDYGKVQLSSIREEKLSLLYMMFHPFQIEIWVTDEIKPDSVSWSKFFTVDMMKLQGTQTFPSHMNFIIEEEQKVAMFCVVKMKKGKLTNMVYIVGEDELREEEDFGESSITSPCPIMFSYVPSLVQI
ncbi:putative F-box protein At3g17620 [Eutrema salsugineum]|uniref:putative F-box protein At3g17620 n=1 Tax=Eutrema salsugineum TaxID=72664 RepID=UPI000CECE66B|nr:putative F-box protein At3g17620 [Eutrema salsugineum]